ncbi:MAG: hypothetical protein MUF58_23840 [Arcicella sp.]|jgi:hypothetical protein|nr:hypothetical protein [Arcicella sp.]
MKKILVIPFFLGLSLISNAQCFKINSWQTNYIPNITATSCEESFHNRVWVKVIDTENMWVSVALNDSHIAIYPYSNPLNYYFTGYLRINPNVPTTNPPSLENVFLLGDTGNQTPTYNKSPVQSNCPNPGRFGCIANARSTPRRKN